MWRRSPELGLDSQIFLLQLLQTPAAFVKGSILLKSIRTESRDQSAATLPSSPDLKDPSEGAQRKEEESGQKRLWGEVHAYLAGFKSPHKVKNDVMDPMMNVRLEKKNTQNLIWTTAEGRLKLQACFIDYSDFNLLCTGLPI